MNNNIISKLKPQNSVSEVATDNLYDNLAGGLSSLKEHDQLEAKIHNIKVNIKSINTFVTQQSIDPTY